MHPLYVTVGTVLACVGSVLVAAGGMLAGRGTVVAAEMIGYTCDPLRGPGAGGGAPCRSVYRTSDGDVLTRTADALTGVPGALQSVRTLTENDADTWSPAYEERRTAFVVLLVCGGLCLLGGLAVTYAGAAVDR